MLCNVLNLRILAKLGLKVSRSPYKSIGESSSLFKLLQIAINWGLHPPFPTKPHGLRLHPRKWGLCALVDTHRLVDLRCAGKGCTLGMSLELFWLVVSTPLKNISQLGWLFPTYGKIKHVPNHQPDYIWSTLARRLWDAASKKNTAGYPWRV